MTTQSNLEIDWRAMEPSRRQRFEKAVGGPIGGRSILGLVGLAQRGLRAMYDPERQAFPQTMRGHRSPDGVALTPEGDSLRYAAIVALGLGGVSLAEQRLVLAGLDVPELVGRLVPRAARSEDVGAVALVAWAAAEVAGTYAEELFLHIDRRISSSHPIDTVECSWALTAVLSASGLADLAELRDKTAARLRAAQGPGGLFPHVLPAQHGYRAHVGSFADQVYPIQALARLHVVTDDAGALAAANRCADRIVALQGAQGQWWWHYDARGDSVVEGFPVYSVHQHAMAPMTLLDLAEAGGHDHSAAVLQGLRWLDRHPEVMPELVSEPLGVIWRKVGRREPPKLSRGLAAVATARRPGTKVPMVDKLMPPGPIDYECRPYELGWLVYAWTGSGVLGALAGAGAGHA